MPNHIGADRVVLDIPPGTNSSVEKTPGEALEHQGTNMPIAPMFKRGIQQIIEARYSLISSK